MRAGMRIEGQSGRILGVAVDEHSKESRLAVFIGSSVEAQVVAHALQSLLGPGVEATVWDQDVFALSANALDSLVRIVARTDFAVFVFTPGDVARIRRKQYYTARDNVVFELGLCIGALGRDRCFIIIPSDAGGGPIGRRGQ